MVVCYVLHQGGPAPCATHPVRAAGQVTTLLLRGRGAAGHRQHAPNGFNVSVCLSAGIAAKSGRHTMDGVMAWAYDQGQKNREEFYELLNVIRQKYEQQAARKAARAQARTLTKEEDDMCDLFEAAEDSPEENEE